MIENEKFGEEKKLSYHKRRCLMDPEYALKRAEANRVAMAKHMAKDLEAYKQKKIDCWKRRYREDPEFRERMKVQAHERYVRRKTASQNQKNNL